MLFSRLAQFAAALALLTIGFAAPVHAQLNQPITSGTFYEDRASGSASNNDFITLTFTQTPANKYLNVTNISCAIPTSINAIVTTLQVQAGTSPGLSDLNRIYSLLGALTSQTVNSSRFNALITNQVFYKFGPGRYPSILIGEAVTTGTTFFSAQCTIVGNLTDN